MEFSKSESLSLSSSSSSSLSSKADAEAPPASAPVPSLASSILPPRSPSTYHQKPQNEPAVHELNFHEIKTASNNTNNQQQSNSFNTKLQRQNYQDQQKSAKNTQSIGWNDGKLAADDISLKDDNNSSDGKIHKGERNQNQIPRHKAKPTKHKRKVSWGGKSIQIPQSYNLNPVPSLPLLDRTEDHFNDVDGRNDKKSGGNQKATRTKAASEIVSAIEATMGNDGIDTSLIVNISSASAVNTTDLAKMHPIESEAALEILNAIESQDREHLEDRLRDEEQSEVVANLFTPTDTKLLHNVPEGAEGLFRSLNNDVSHVSSVAGDTTANFMSENLNCSSHCRTEPPLAMAGRSRIDSATQFSIASTLEGTISNTRKSSAGHRRTNTMASNPTITSTGRNPRQPKMHNYDYRRHRHRRQETMEERLFSLNQALDAVDAPVSTEQSTSKRQNREPKQEYQENTPSFHHKASASLDLFNQNLARLFQDIGRNPGNGQNHFDGKEIMPLTHHVFGSSTHPSTGNNNVSEDPVDDDFSKSSEHKRTKESIRSASNSQWENVVAGSAISSPVKIYQNHELPPKPGDDIEMGTYNNTPSNAVADDSTPSFGNTGKKKWSRFHRFMNKIGLLHDMEFFLKSRTYSILRYLRNLFWLALIATLFSAALYYLLGNPPMIHDGELVPYPRNITCRFMPDKKVTTLNGTNGASYSWWILYFLVRLPITFTIALSLEIFLIDFLILECRWVGSCMGSTFTLLIVQAKGWPAILFFWSLCSLFTLYGTSPFVNHWGYWQDYVELFNECNGSGTIIASDINLKVQLIALIVSIVVAVKRLLIGFHQGRKTYLHYAEELSTVMTKILLICEISNLALELELEAQEEDDFSNLDDSSYAGEFLNHFNKENRSKISGIDSATQILKRNIDDEEGVDTDGSLRGSSLKTVSTYKTNATRNKLFISDHDEEVVTGLLSQSQKRRIERLLGNWEEPEHEKILTENVSIGAILQFRKSLSKLDSAYPFSYAFGKADTRDHAIQSSQNIYLRLLETSPDKIFHFNILGLVALQRDGSLDQEKLKILIKVFRPDRDGLLSLTDFVKSTDIVYKKMKLLRASVRSSKKIDKSFERIFNVFFYFVIACIILDVLGYDPIAVFLSFSSVVLAFSFMISQASSKYVEGLLFILYRRPYDIGDCISIQPVDEPTSLDGSTEWVVRDIDLFTTTVIYVRTNEVATLSNGSIANSRVMNGARSLPAIIYIDLRFGVDTAFEKLQLFREAVSQYVDKRPREWTKLLRITNPNVQADEGFVEYRVGLQHVSNWQHLESVLASRSQARYFCHELSKQLDMRYKSPPLPVDLNINDSLKVLKMALTSEDNFERKIVPSIAKMSAESDEIRNLIRDRRM